MKILCVCQDGNSRSVALAWILKHQYHHDALAMGIRRARRGTRTMLYQWADKIILTTDKYVTEIPEEFRAKLLVFHVGSDRWFRGFDADLLERFHAYILQTDWTT